MTAGKSTDSYPGRSFYITSASFDKVDADLPKQQTFVDFVTETDKIVHIKHD